MTNTGRQTLYEGLLVKLVAVLHLVRSSDGANTPNSKQALFQAVSHSILHPKSPPRRLTGHRQTNNFKSAMNQAREFAITLPGGEMLIEEQDEVIDMLERLRDRKRFVHSGLGCAMLHYSLQTREQLSHFSDCALSSTLNVSDQHKMEVDSMASTPYAPT